MEDKRGLEQQARALIDNNPDEAVKIYRQIWDNFRAEFNDWDAFFTIKAMKNINNPDFKWAFLLAENFKTDKVGNIYSWLIFDKVVKGKSRNELIASHNKIVKLVDFASQKNLRLDNSFPCPITISIMKLCDEYSDNMFNATKINELLSLLDYNLLSSTPQTKNTQDRGNIEFASDLEKYFSLKTKSLFKLAEYEECKVFCKIALEQIQQFHNNNDTWFKMRFALSEYKLGNNQSSEILLQELLSTRTGSDKWFLYKDIAEVFYEQSDFEKAWKYAVDAVYYGNEPHFLIGLYLLQTRILFKLKRVDDGKVLAELIASILNEQNWRDKERYNKLFNFYQIDRNITKTVSELVADAKILWDSERYNNKERTKGTIISIHNNNKIGRIITEDNRIIDFHKKDFSMRVNSIQNLKNVEVEFFIMNSFDNRLIAENISIIKKNHVNHQNELIGKTFIGTVKNSTDYGIFINLDGSSDGLLHKKNLPESYKNNFKITFPNGSDVKVIVDKVTEKGIQLKLIEK